MMDKILSTRSLLIALFLGASVMLLPRIALAVDTKLIDDARTDSVCPTCNYGADGNISVQQPDQKSYIKFDLSTLPAGTVGNDVAMATLKLWVNTVSTGGSFDIYNVTSVWTEEAVTHNSVPTLGVIEATAVPVTTASAKKFITVDLTALVKDWLNGVLANNGIALIANAAGTNVSFDSKENQNHSHEPKLEIVLARPIGDITAVFAGTGLAGGGTSGDVTLSIASSYQLPQSCVNGQVAKSNGLGGWACAGDNDSGGDITAVNAGTGLTGGGTSGDVTLSIASSYQLPQLCTIGQVAKSNGTGGWTCANDIDTIGIGGSGTTNYVPKFTAATTIGNSAITEVGGNVGIGTTSPAERLHLYSPSGSLALKVQTDGAANDHGRIQFQNNLGKVWDIGMAGSGSTSVGPDRFYIWNPTLGVVMAIKHDTGNVGIGTTSPASDSKLHIFVPASAASDARIKVQSLGTGNVHTVVRYENDAAKQWDVGLSGSGSTSVGPNRFYWWNGVVRMVIDDTGNVGIGTTTPTSLLDVAGTLTAVTKNFQIDHPLEPDKKLLVHSALEGPEVAVYYRGEAQLDNGEVSITLPAYFEALTRKEQRTVQLTPIKGWAPLYVADDIQDGRFTVRTANGGNPNQRFYWEVKAVRADVPALVVEKLKEAKSMKLAESMRSSE